MKRFLPFVFLMLSMCICDAATPVPVEIRRVPDGGIKPSVVADASGALHMVYFAGAPMAGDAFYTVSKDGAAT